jgi:tellurite resistance protein
MFRFGAMGGAQGYRVAGFVLLALLVLTILALAVRTFRAALAGDICQPE